MHVRKTSMRCAIDRRCVAARVPSAQLPKKFARGSTPLSASQLDRRWHLDGDAQLNQLIESALSRPFSSASAPARLKKPLAVRCMALVDLCPMSAHRLNREFGEPTGSPRRFQASLSQQGRFPEAMPHRPSFPRPGAGNPGLFDGIEARLRTEVRTAGGSARAGRPRPLT